MSIYIENAATSHTPLLKIDLGEGLFLMEGVCIPEDGPGFFGPLIATYAEGIKQLKQPAIMRFNLKYFNSSSLKGLYMLFKKIDELNTDDRDLRIEWMVEENDEDLFEPADVLAAMISTPMEIKKAA